MLFTCSNPLNPEQSLLMPYIPISPTNLPTHHYSGVLHPPGHIIYPSLPSPYIICHCIRVSLSLSEPCLPQGLHQRVPENLLRNFLSTLQYPPSPPSLEPLIIFADFEYRAYIHPLHHHILTLANVCGYFLNPIRPTPLFLPVLPTVHLWLSAPSYPWYSIGILHVFPPLSSPLPPTCPMNSIQTTGALVPPLDKKIRHLGICPLYF